MPADCEPRGLREAVGTNRARLHRGHLVIRSGLTDRIPDLSMVRVREERAVIVVDEDDTENDTGVVNAVLTGIDGGGNRHAAYQQPRGPSTPVSETPCGSILSSTADEGDATRGSQRGHGGRRPPGGYAAAASKAWSSAPSASPTPVDATTLSALVSRLSTSMP